jgi:ADP-ribosylation factor GTPase-activating protein 2/3
MGVHTTFVRSVDLDEWTQRQIDAMRLGGNDNARKFFRKNGVDMQTKIDKKYTTKAAQLYRQELEKLVVAEAAKRGEGPKPSSSDSTVTAASLLDNLSLAEQQQTEQEAKDKLAAARAQAAPPVQAAAKTAAELHGKGKLITPPTSGNAPKIVLRPPSNVSKNLLKKKPSGSSIGSKLRVNKIATSEDAVDASFDDVEATQAAVVAEPEVVAEPTAATPQPEVAPLSPAPESKVESPYANKNNLQHQNSMEAGVAKLQQMNNDFFSGL